LKSLRNVKIEKCKDIGAIFRECTSLKEIRISENVQYIAGEAFRECSSLEKVYVCNPDTRIEINSFEATVKSDNAIIKKVTWTSSNSKVASVSSSGKITAKHPGTAVITGMTINGKSAKCTINVRPQGTPITKLQSQKKRWLNIQYRANRNADGYQIQYGTASNMKGAKYAAVKNSAIRSYTRKDVKSGATYYVRVRTFNIVNGKRIYSDWSGIKRMRVK